MCVALIVRFILVSFPLTFHLLCVTILLFYKIQCVHPTNPNLLIIAKFCQYIIVFCIYKKNYYIYV